MCSKDWAEERGKWKKEVKASYNFLHACDNFKVFNYQC